jgi:hypothetical protein
MLSCPFCFREGGDTLPRTLEFTQPPEIFGPPGASVKLK